MLTALAFVLIGGLTAPAVPSITEHLPATPARALPIAVGPIARTPSAPAPTAALAMPASRLTAQAKRQFQADLAERLPALHALFAEAAADNGLDWRLLAAIAYQESHWEASASSPNGARGLMMLTLQAAETVGVADRDDPRESIFGGARYLAHVLRAIPRHIAEPDRTWMALAAYNAGYGHVEDARVLTQMLGGNPNTWQDVREQLPLLEQEQWYSLVKRGYARGSEPARYVDQVRRYAALLDKYRAPVPVPGDVTPTRYSP